MDSDRFEFLLDRYVSGTATLAEEAELQQLLQADADWRRRFVERLLLEVHLRKAFAGIVAPRPVRRWPARRLVALAVAASVLLVVGASLLAYFSRTGPATDKGAGPVTTREPPTNDVLTGEVKVDGVAVRHIPEGQWFEVAGEAPAVVRLTDGTETEFVPASRVILHVEDGKERPAVELDRGAGKFKVAPGAPFRVKTPVGTVTVLGTRFSVKLEARAPREGRNREERLSMLVAVAEGSVKVDVGEKSTTLKAGESRTFSPSRKKEDDD